MPNYQSAVPAYGADYRTRKEVLAAWEAGKDFLIQGVTAHGYVNKDDKPPDMQLNIRYRNRTMICVIPAAK